jgi:hypothetical protein
MVKVGSYTLDYSMFEQTGNVFAAYGLEDTGTKKLGSMEKISHMRFVPVQKVKKMLLGGRILNAASIVALYRVIHYHEETRPGK